MLSLQDQCVSLDLAKKLKELNFPQDTLFLYRTYWKDGLREEEGEIFLKEMWDLIVEERGDNGCHFICAAPTVAELGEWLPEVYATSKYHDLDSDCIKWIAEFDGEHIYDFYCDKEADARASLLIHLVKQGIISFTTPSHV